MNEVKTIFECTEITKQYSEQVDFLQKIIDTIPQPIFFKNTNGEYLGCNQAFEKFHRLTRDQIIGKTIYEVTADDAAQLYHRQDEALFRKQEVDVEENIIINDNRLFVMNKKTYLNDQGSIGGLVGIINDITELKEHQQELQRSQERFKALVNSMEDIVFTLDLDGVCSGFYGQWAINLGLSDKEMNSKKLDAILGDSYREFEQKIIPKILSGQHILYECRLNLPTGMRDIQISLSPIYGEYNKIAGIVGVGRDVTVQKMALESLGKSENMHRSLVEATPYGIIMTDVSGQIQMANQHSASLHEFDDPEEMLGRNILAMVIPKDRKLLQGKFFQVLATQQAQTLECMLYKNNGSSFMSEILTSSVLDEQGNPILFINAERDITERKKMEDTLKTQNEELQSMLSQLRAAQMKLIQQEKLAGIGQLAAGVAHEINNPLGFITSNFTSLKNYVDRLSMVLNEYRNLVQIIENSDGSSLSESINLIHKIEREKKIDFVLEDIKDLFKESTEGLERVGKIVTGLRTFARIDQDSNFQEYDLNAGIKNTLLIAKNEIKYWANVEENFSDIPVIEVVGSYINQVLLNIIVNGAQAIKQKGTEELGLIKITTYADDEFVYCEIADNGIGISEPNQQKVFEPFFTTKPIGQGTGLGLSISYDIIVNKHHGEIILQSMIGTGTTFTIKLPIHQGQQEEVI
ncbi:PAS domain S-box protein [Pelosinus sp. sgz500959]|uniref:PAS domain S-box protein n=1 Tax=Pelosinus sp. sgz500959 TaxID=3242472 RepID=UPI00367089CD